MKPYDARPQKGPSSLSRFIRFVSRFTRLSASTADGSPNMEESNSDIRKDKHMSKLLKSRSNGLFFIEGRGFTGTVAQATRFEGYGDVETAQKCAARNGIDSVIENAPAVDENIKQNADGTSFAVSFIRQKDLRADGSVAANARNPSKRRFATRAEAEQHADRYVRIEKHVGKFITVTRDPVNAYVNPKTGLTNPVIGKGRIGR